MEEERKEGKEKGKKKNEERRIREMKGENRKRRKILVNIENNCLNTLLE